MDFCQSAFSFAQLFLSVIHWIVYMFDILGMEKQMEPNQETRDPLGPKATAFVKS